jgi:hypothetical protein
MDDAISVRQSGRLECRVCGSRRAACFSLINATQYAGMWCPELERALDRAPSRAASASREKRLTRGET